MGSLFRWIHDLFYCSSGGDPKTQNGEKEGQEWPSMAVTLRTMEQTMDPVVVTQVWNNSHSPFASLPEEIIIKIFDHLYLEDDVSMFCLRRTCRTFRRIIFEPRFWRKLCAENTLTGDYNTFESYFRLTMDEANRLKQLLQRDGMCRSCALYCDGPVKGLTRQIAHYFLSEYSPKRVFHSRCKFQRPGGRHVTCESCGKYHDMICFSGVETNQFFNRDCLAREGSVQLCEHVHICWSQIENHLKKWYLRAPGDWQACFNDFKIECTHPSHDTRCTPQTPPTWPRASLDTCLNDANRVILHLEWAPHSGFKCFNVANKKVPAPELRELFKKYRQGAARVFLPALPSNPLPEMGCFDPDSCYCVHYEGMQYDEKLIIENSVDQDRPEQNLWFHRCNCLHYQSRNYGSGYNGHRVEQIKHYPDVPDNQPVQTCLITTYEREIFVCRKDDKKHGAIPVTHEWFHAMDPDTYPRPDNEHALPLCRNENCMNYYKKPQTYNCVGHE
ncbi:hypothetical protein F4805DRAFT_411986 [Annulohypoxylon moriforme]|nr:hypothetical protein F4805DRAFT_411986 [Annulohypoxylon moriforme]